MAATRGTIINLFGITGTILFWEWYGWFYVGLLVSGPWFECCCLLDVIVLSNFPNIIRPADVCSALVTVSTICSPILKATAPT